jgi:hypothetical protein
MAEQVLAARRRQEAEKLLAAAPRSTSHTRGT